MTILLPPELELLVQSKLESGQYHSPSEVIREALQLMDERDRLEDLKRFVAVGIEQADRGELIEASTVFAQVRERIRQKTSEPT